MKPKSKQTPRNILSSVNEYEFRHLNDIQRKKKEQDEDQHIFYYQKSQDRNMFQNSSRKISNDQKSTRKKSQRYLKGNKQKNSELFFSKTYDQNFFSSSKKVAQKRQQKQTHKTISNYQILLQHQSDPRVLQLALRYGILNRKSKNSFNQILKKKSKRSNNPNFYQLMGKRNAKLSIDSNPDYQFQRALQNNKNTLQSVGISPNNYYDQNFSMMLDRKKIVQSVQKKGEDKLQGNFSIIGPKKRFADNIKINQNKNGRKIQLFVNQKIQIGNQHLKKKINTKQMAKTYSNQFPVQNKIFKSNHKQELIYNQTKNPKQTHMKNWSNKMYCPQNSKPLKQQSFVVLKNTTQRIQTKIKIQLNKQILKGRKSDINCSEKYSHVSIIPDSIIFKKKQNSDNKKLVIGKIVKNISKQMCLKQQNILPIKKLEKSQNSLNLLGKIQSKLILQRKNISKNPRPSTEGSPARLSRKQNYFNKNNELTFVFDSKDHPYIAQYLIANGWSLFIPGKLNSQSTLKWVNNPVTSDILKLKDGQLYNHFHKSFELTSKSFLSLNLRANQHLLKTNSYFPQTFDIGNEIQSFEFIKKFNFNVMMILLQNIIKYCYRKGKISHLLDNFMQIQEQDLFIQKQSNMILQSQSFNVIEFQNYRNKDESFQINIYLVILALKYYRKQRAKYYLDFKEKKTNCLRFKKGEFDSNFSFLQFYSKKQDLSRPQDQKGLFSYHFATPSDLLLQILVKQYCFFYKLNKWSLDLESEQKNSSNTWIIKPSSNARGNGIYLETNIVSILKSAKDIQSRIVQKYIEKPLLLRKTPYAHLNNHKFDIRQWVLLKSLDPLEIYMFSHFYIRLASENYELYPIENNKVHLTNYSANKQYFDNQKDSIVSSDEFIKFLKEEYDVEWQNDLKPLIQEIIIKSIRSCQQKLETPQNGTCFQLLGYDIFIDEYFHPWLIEVNMSPACEQRTPWLTDYLKNMNEGLLDIVLPQTHIINKQKQKRNQYWQRILFEEYHFNAKDFNGKLQVVSINLQMKNKLSRQNQPIKSNKCIEGPLSPKKVKNNNIKKTIRKESAKKIQKIQDQQKQTIFQQNYRIKTVSQVDPNTLFQSIQIEDLIENQIDYENEGKQFIEQIQQIQNESIDSFEEKILEEEYLPNLIQEEEFQQFQEFQEMQEIQNN